MGCFRCSGESSLLKKKNRNNHNNSGYHRCRIHDHAQASSPDAPKASPHNFPMKQETRDAHLSILENTAKETAAAMENTCNGEATNGKARAFRYAELVAATHNFKFDNFLGEGGFGSVYKGRLEDTGEIVAIKQLDRYGFQGTNEFLIEVFTLCNAKHSNLIKLIGYCVEGNQFLLVYEYMPLGSLEDHLYDPLPHKEPLDWNTRMKILAGSARGLEYLHNKMRPPIIYRDLKCSNILLGEGYHPKLSDFGLAKVGPKGDMTHVSTRVMGTYGYCAPDYAATGQLTFKSDIYSFGVVLLEIISGRRAIDNTRPGPEQNLVEWAKPIFKDRTKFHHLADPALEGRYSVKGLYQAISIAAICLQEKANMRPQISELVSALNYIVSHTNDSPKARSNHNPRRACSSGKLKRDEHNRDSPSGHSKEMFN